MKKLFAALLILFCMAGFSAAATYYVKPGGNDALNGLSVANAWLTIQKAASTAIANDVVRILPGTYAEQVEETTAGVTFEAYDAGDKPIIDGESIRADGFRINGQNVTLRNIKVIGTTWRAFAHWGGDGVLFEGCEAYDNDDVGFAIVGEDTMSYCRSEGNGGYNLHIQDALEVYYSLFRGPLSVYVHNTVAPGETVNFYNCLFVKADGNALYTRSAGDVNLKNCLVYGNAQAYRAQQLWAQAGSVLNYQNCLVLPSWSTAGMTIGQNLVDGGNNITTQYPVITNFAGTSGYIILRVDDYVTWAEGWAAKAAEYGFNISFFATQAEVMGEANYGARMQALEAAGHEIGVHGYSHYPLDSTQLFIIQYDGADTSPTIDVDQTAKTIELRTAEGNDDETIVATDTKTYGDLVGELAAMSWSSTGLGDHAFAYYNDVWLSGLQDTAGAVALIGAPPVRTMDLNQAAFWTDEIDEVKTWTEGIVGGAYEVKSLAYPGNVYDEDVEDAVRDAGLLAATGDDPRTGRDLADLQIFHTAMQYFSAAIYGDGTEAVTRANTRGLMAMLAENNMVLVLGNHAPSAYLLTRFGWMLDEIRTFIAGHSQVSCVTLGAFADTVRSSGDWADADGDGERWTRTFTDAADYRLGATSPSINAGTDVGLTRDYMGTHVPQGPDPDIGGFEFYAYTIKLKDGAGIKLKDGGKVEIK